MSNYLKKALSGKKRKGLRDALTTDSAAVKQASIHQAVPAHIGGNAAGLIGSMGTRGSSGTLYNGRNAHQGANGSPTAQQSGRGNYGYGRGNSGYGNGNSGYGSGSDNNGEGSNSGYESGSFEDYYNSLIETLQHYGASLDLPSLDSIYAQLEAFLRPATDAAIEDRQEYGETVLAELDADAYSRGMGGSTYLSSMKAREYDAIARDIARLESSYNAELAQYMYDASMEFTRIRTELMEIELQHRYAMEQLRYQHQLSSSGKGSGDSEGDASSGNGGGDYESYYSYLASLSAEDKWNFLNSKDSIWKNMRESAKASLSAADYARLMREINAMMGGGNGSGSGSGSSSGSGGHGGSTYGGGHTGGHGAVGHSGGIHVYN